MLKHSGLVKFKSSVDVKLLFFIKTLYCKHQPLFCLYSITQVQRFGEEIPENIINSMLFYLYNFDLTYRNVCVIIFSIISDDLYLISLPKMFVYMTFLGYNITVTNDNCNSTSD